jgi:uncharacterized protein with HEPN domain
MPDAGQKAISFAANRKRTDLGDDPMLAFALMKAIEIIGEAASRISVDSQERLTEIPWREIVGMRNRLIMHTLTSASTFCGTQCPTICRRSFKPWRKSSLLSRPNSLG